MKTKKNHKTNKVKTLKSRTPKDIQLLSNEINEEIKNTGKARGLFDFFNFSKPTNHNPAKQYKLKRHSSYTPTVNDDLITLKSIPREKLRDCNNTKAFKLKVVSLSTICNCNFLFGSLEIENFAISSSSLNINAFLFDVYSKSIFCFCSFFSKALLLFSCATNNS